MEIYKELEQWFSNGSHMAPVYSQDIPKGWQEKKLQNGEGI